jgi:hypothetical protein
VSWSNQVKHQLQFFGAAMTRNVHRRLRAVIVIGVGGPLVNVINHPGDRLFIARNDPGGNDHRIAWLNLDVLIVTDSQPR